MLHVLGAGALAAPFGLSAQQSTKVYQIGILRATAAADYKGRINALWAGP